MKKGDIVIIRDRSYATGIKDGELFQVNSNRGKYKVIMLECKFPVDNPSQAYPPAAFNNTVIQCIDSNVVVFIEERFLDLVPTGHDITIDGKTIRISHESYKALKKQLLFD